MSDCISIYFGYNYSQIATNNFGVIVKARQIDKENIPSNLYYFIIIFLSEKKIMDWL